MGKHLGLPLANHLVATDKDGKEQPLPREKFYVPGSLLRVRVDPTNPLAWGLGETVDVMFSASPTFRLMRCRRAATVSQRASRVGASPGSTARRRCAAAGPGARSILADGVAIVEAEVGTGRLVLFGPQIVFRAQPHGTFKFLFNGIVQAGMKE